jgi:hypothetical protein
MGKAADNGDVVRVIRWPELGQEMAVLYIVEAMATPQSFRSALIDLRYESTD